MFVMGSVGVQVLVGVSVGLEGDPSPSIITLSITLSSLSKAELVK